MKVLLAVLALIVIALIGGAYLGFNPTIPIFIILMLAFFWSAAPPAVRTYSFHRAHTYPGAPVTVSICEVRILCLPIQTTTAAAICATGLIRTIQRMLDKLGSGQVGRIR